MNQILSRRAVVAGGLASAFAGLGGAQAQEAWPSKPINLIVPFTPGGSTDILARIIGQKFNAAWGQGVVVWVRGFAGAGCGCKQRRAGRGHRDARGHEGKRV